MKNDALVAFASVVDEGTFTAAATAVGRSQPAISKLVAQLEDELGLTLFDRTAYRPVLTAHGRAFYDRVVPVLEQTAALVRFGESLAGRGESVVRLALDSVVPLTPVANVLRSLESEAAHVRIELQTLAFGEAIEALHGDRTDLAIGHRHDDSPGLGFAQLRRHSKVGVVAVVHHAHPLAQHDGTPTASMLRVYPQIILRDGSTAPRPLNVLAGGRHWSVTDVHAKKQLIIDGMGWGGLPEHVVADELSSGTLVTLQVREFETRSLQLHLGRRRHGSHGPVAQRLWEILADQGKPPTRRRGSG